jgi:hypothetical protein
MQSDPTHCESFAWVLNHWNTRRVEANGSRFKRLLRNRRSRYLFIRKMQKAMLDQFGVEGSDFHVLIFLGSYLHCRTEHRVQPNTGLFICAARNVIGCFKGDDDGFEHCWEDFVRNLQRYSFKLGGMDTEAPGPDDEATEPELEAALAEVLEAERAAAVEAEP